MALYIEPVWQVVDSCSLLSSGEAWCPSSGSYPVRNIIAAILAAKAIVLEYYRKKKKPTTAFPTPQRTAQRRETAAVSAATHRRPQPS